MLVALSWWVQEDPSQVQPRSTEAEKNGCVKTGQCLRESYVLLYPTLNLGRGVVYGVLWTTLMLDFVF